MSLRFQKRITLFPGVRLNLSTGMPSLSIGPRGASLTVGKRGVYGNVGVPGSGLSYRTRFDKPNGRQGRSASSKTSDAPPTEPPPAPPPVFTLRIRGAVVEYIDEAGSPLSDADIAMVKSHYRDELLKHLGKRADELNESRLSLAKLHLSLKPPAPVLPIPVIAQIESAPVSYSIPKPARPADPAAMPAFMEQLSAWRVAKTEFEKAATANSNAPVANIPDLEAIAAPIMEQLGAVEWPRETNIDLDLCEDGTTLILHVDLPEIEDMPVVTYAVSRSNVDIVEKPVSQTAIASLYAEHVHAIAMRLIGEAFSASGVIKCVQFDGYTQRKSTATGRMADQYVLCINATRALWSAIDFDNLDDIDPVAAVERFELRRDMKSRGHLKEVKPFRT